jgi:MFS family permease
MERLRNIVFGPWRAVLVLGVTQILAWGFLWYPPVLTLPLIAAERGWSLSFAMAGLSVGLLVGGLTASTIGHWIDRFGGHVVMTAGSLAGAAGLVSLVIVEHHVSYFLTWMFLGVAMAASLYDSAFATLGRIFGAQARRPITLLTFAGGFASTLGWPATLFLIDLVGWRGAYLTFAALLAFVAAPLHAFVLPRTRAVHAAATVRDLAQHETQPPATSGRAVLPVLIPVAAAFAAFAFITSGLSAHMLAIIGRGGIDPATAVAIGALFGPAQVLARLCEYSFAGHMHPLLIARSAVTLMLMAFALLILAGISVPVAAGFAVMFGMSNGLITVARGTVPLALFGAVGYGRMVGRIAGGALVMQSVAPVTLAFVIERQSDRAALIVLALFAATALAGFLVASRRAANQALTTPINRK